MYIQNKYKDKRKFSRNQQKLKSNTTAEYLSYNMLSNCSQYCSSDVGWHELNKSDTHCSNMNVNMLLSTHLLFCSWCTFLYEPGTKLQYIQLKHLKHFTLTPNSIKINAILSYTAYRDYITCFANSFCPSILTYTSGVFNSADIIQF